MAHNQALCCLQGLRGGHYYFGTLLTIDSIKQVQGK